MLSQIIGIKLGMIQFFEKNGNSCASTIILLKPPIFLKNLLDKKLNKNLYLYKSQIGKKYIYFSDSNQNKESLNLDYNLIDNDSITIKGNSIGKGNTGNIKRNNFKRGPMSHGSKHHRLQGSLGAGTTPSRVFPGKRMPGRHGNSRVTIKNLKILKLINNILLVKGSIPGKKGNIIQIFK